MKLDDTEAEAAYYGLAGFARERALAGRPVPVEVLDLVARLDTVVRMSPTRHESGWDAHDEGPSEQRWIGSPETAQMLGWSKRQVQRHATEMGGRIIGGRWLFSLDDVLEYAERQAAHGRTRAHG